MVNLISELLPFGVFIFNIATAILLWALIFKNSWGRGVSLWVGKNALVLGFLVSLAAVSGSLFYSVVIGFEPCLLCWWQRIAIFPLLVLFFVALFYKDRGVFRYALPLSVIGALIAIYNLYVQSGGSLAVCDGVNSCDRLYVLALGYVTIPAMSLSIAVAVILLWWSNKIYNANRNS